MFNSINSALPAFVRHFVSYYPILELDDNIHWLDQLNININNWFLSSRGTFASST